jgi:endonuclease/exonuclease/phosphatase family metal-dependent hydrolase
VSPYKNRSAWKTWLLAFLLALGLYVLYAGRRTAVEPQHGSDIHWPDGIQAISLSTCRVATFNIHRGKGTDGLRDLTRIADVLEAVDLAGLNEVGGPVFFGRPDQTEQLGQILRTGWLYAPNQRRYHMDHFGNGLLCRVAVTDWSHQPLIYDKQRSHSHRNLLQARVNLAGTSVPVFITHLDRGELRSTQLQFVLQLFASHDTAILLGDLNTRETDPVLAGFLADRANIDAVEEALGEQDPTGRIDWILLRGLDVQSGGMHPTGVSDHPCFWADVSVMDPND